MKAFVDDVTTSQTHFLQNHLFIDNIYPYIHYHFKNSKSLIRLHILTRFEEPLPSSI